VHEAVQVQRTVAVTPRVRTSRYRQDRSHQLRACPGRRHLTGGRW
jgi:hypothetical protein